MAIQINGTTVIDNSSNITNIANITASGTINGTIIATQAQAEAGTDNTKLMTPLRVAQALSKGIAVINRIQRGSTSLVPGVAPFIDVPIVSVDTTKSFMTSATRGTFASANNAFASARLTSSTNVRASFGRLEPQPPSGTTYSGAVDWEVIEFK